MKHARKNIVFKKYSGKVVIDLNTGIFYDSATEAADILGINRNTLGVWLNYDKSKTSLRYA